MSTPNIPTDVSDRSQFFYLALAVFLSRQQNSLLPESLYFMEPNQLLTFIETFGGSTVRVPSLKEFGDDLILVVALYYRHGRGMTWNAVQDRLDMTDLKFGSLKRKAEEFLEFSKKEINMDPSQLLRTSNYENLKAA
jgi:hypothetical protein